MGHGGGEKGIVWPLRKVEPRFLSNLLRALTYRGSHINDRNKTVAKFSFLECKKVHFVSGILQTFSELRASHGDRNYVFLMGYLQFRACRPLYLTAVTIK